MDGAALARMLGVLDLAERLDVVDQRIRSSLGADDPGFRAALLRVAGGGGKRLRPSLTIACADLLGTWDDRVVDAAAAVELVQIGSLVHDDILDGATTRRGTPTINAVEGPTPALVAGDFFLARAGELASRVSVQAAALVARAVGDLCLGQFLELGDAFDLDRTVERYLRSVRGKTAALFECACRLGAACAGADAATADALGRYGDAFGMAFQVLDDILDLVGDAEKLGKPVGVDVVAGVYTLPVLHALAGADGAVVAAALRDDPAPVEPLVVHAGGVEAATGWVERFTVEAAAAVEPLGADWLAAFPRTYVAWALDAFGRT